MRKAVRQSVAFFLCELLILLPPMGDARARQQQEQARSAQTLPLRDYLQKSYLDLFELAPKLEFSAAEIAMQREAFKNGKKMCVARFKDHSKQYGKQIEVAQKDLKAKTAKLSEEERAQMHCNIQNLDLLRSEADVLANLAIPNAYDNMSAKLDLIEQWPAQRKQIQQDLDSGAYLTRRWGDVKDIGFRAIEPKQEDDIKRGAQAVEEMKRLGLLPPEVEDKTIQEYVRSVAERVAKTSDLKVPLHISVLQSREINAFALPGGYMFVERGLLEAADDESELAGVIAHEIAHDTARHSYKLMKKATISSLLYQAAQVAAMVLTGGAAGIAMSYILQYGFYGLGLVINLQLLGVSRDYELEADQLGVQYAWNAGYDPSGFVRFFDKMATKQGYVNSVSWFRTHPPFFQRMVQTEREIMFLQPKANPTTQTAAFEQMKKDLAPIAAKADMEEIGKPSLLITKEQGCAPPRKLEYKADQPIEQICASEPVTLPNSKANPD